MFDKEGNGYIGQGELKYVLTNLGEKMSEQEVDELLKGVSVTSYAAFSLSCRDMFADSFLIKRRQHQLCQLCSPDFGPVVLHS